MERLALRYRRMSFDDSEEQLRRQAEDVDTICELHEYRTKSEWLFADDDESGNEDTRYRQGKGERPGLAALNEVASAPAAQGSRVTWWPGCRAGCFATRATRSTTSAAGPAGRRPGPHEAGCLEPEGPRDRFVSTIVAGVMSTTRTT